MQNDQQLINNEESRQWQEENDYNLEMFKIFFPTITEEEYANEKGTL